jgi:peptide-methionine (S)-S-oxide reductase
VPVAGVASHPAVAVGEGSERRHSSSLSDTGPVGTSATRSALPPTHPTSEGPVLFSRHKTAMVEPGDALAGRDARPFTVPSRHYVLDTPLEPPYVDGLEVAYVAMGCFWGAERAFWTMPGVYTTAVGYQGGYTANPTYEEVCSARTGHAEAVKIVFDPARISYRDLLKVFWESHDPTQGMRQGNDVGTQYRSAIYVTSDAQKQAALETRDAFQPVLDKAGYGAITTEIAAAGDFYYAEDYHQQYLAKNPAGYCGLGGTGQSCPVGVARASQS